MKRRPWLLIVAIIISTLVACEIPVEPVKVVITEVDYVDLKWIASIYQLHWSTDGCLSGSDGLMYVTGENPSCDSTDGEEYGLLRMHSIQYDYNDNRTIYALLDFSYPEHPEVIRTKQIQLWSYQYEEK